MARLATGTAEAGYFADRNRFDVSGGAAAPAGIGVPVERFTTNAVFNGANQPVNPSSTIASGTTAILVAMAGSVHVTGDQYVNSVTDSKSNTWTVDRSYHAVVANMRGITIASAPITSSILTTDTVTLAWAVSANQGRAIWIFEVSGLSAAPFDTGADANGSGTALSAGPTSSLATANELVLGCFSRNSGGTFTAGATYTALGTTQTEGAVQYKIVSASTAVTAGGTYSISRTWGASVVAYKGA